MNPELEETYDLEYTSKAANNKMRGILESILVNESSVTVVSPIFVNNNSSKFYPSQNVIDDELGVTLHTPAIIDIYALNYILLAITTTLLTLRHLFQREYDTIVFYDFQVQTAIPAIIGSILFRVPAVLEYEDGLFFHENIIIRWMAKILRPSCSRFIHGAICVNEPLAELLPSDNVTIVRGFPSIGMPDELPDPVYQQEETVVMFAGRFDTVRGIDTFLEIVDEMDDLRGVKFWISGYGADQEMRHIKSRVDSMDDDQITYFGTLPWEDYRARVVSSDILVNFQDPSKRISEYTFPSKLLDFMSADNIVVSTDMSDLEEYFSDKILVSGKSKQQLKMGLREAIETPEDFDARRKRARRWIETECSRSSVGKRVLKVVKEAEK